MYRLVTLLLLLPSVASACPVCFGKADDAKGLIMGLTWGLGILLAATFAIVAALAYAIYRLEKRKELKEAAEFGTL